MGVCKCHSCGSVNSIWKSCFSVFGCLWKRRDYGCKDPEVRALQFHSHWLFSHFQCKKDESILAIRTIQMFWKSWIDLLFKHLHWCTTLLPYSLTTNLLCKTYYKWIVFLVLEWSYRHFTLLILLKSYSFIAIYNLRTGFELWNYRWLWSPSDGHQ